MAQNLQHVVTGILGQMQVCRDFSRKEVLREQLLRVDTRLLVLERVSWRGGKSVPVDAKDSVCRLTLEKMADAFEEGTAAWQEEGVGGRRVLAGAMLEVAVSHAALAQRDGRLERFVRGPFAGLGALAALVAAAEDLLEMEDLPRLGELVALARRVPATEVLESECLACDDFRDALLKFEYRLRARETGSIREAGG
ncbi:hypothetical protein [Hyphomicrobium sp. CS1BSMeth3]|uniref:hypothetical protein n=1 Tax=Hyphomicrobium sp. CS1BSMeth3 TaxID=1892844 RepID=UPI0011608990|nr:hypothetical protein [Hyphomicrobium sp. CS1BSMeth3]